MLVFWPHPDICCLQKVSHNVFLHVSSQLAQHCFLGHYFMKELIQQDIEPVAVCFRLTYFLLYASAENH